MDVGCYESAQPGTQDTTQPTATVAGASLTEPTLPGVASCAVVSDACACAVEAHSDGGNGAGCDEAVAGAASVDGTTIDGAAADDDSDSDPLEGIEYIEVPHGADDELDEEPLTREEIRGRERELIKQQKKEKTQQAALARKALQGRARAQKLAEIRAKVKASAPN
jgi:hypothetical protein